MLIQVNGEPKAIEDGSVSISKLLELQKVKSPEMVSVQLNGEFVDRSAYVSTLLSENDEVDFLYFMGGGK